MKITTKNYFETIKKIGFENLPMVLKQAHTVITVKTDVGKNWSEYKNNADLKRMINTAFKKLEEFITSENNSINGMEDEKDLSGNYLTPKEVAINLIKPYVLKGDTIELHPANHLSIEEPDYAAHIENESVVVTMLYGTKISESFLVNNLMAEIVKEDFKTKYNSTNSFQTNSVRKKRTTFNHKQPEFRVLKAILNWHNANVSKRQVEFFINELQGYIQSKKITKKSLVAKEISLVQEKLVSIFNSMGERIKIELSPETKKIFQSALMKVTDVNKFNNQNDKKGLGEIPSPNKQEQAPKQNIMSSMDFANLKFNTIGLKDKWLDFIGDPAPGFTAMVHGKPKMGKSYLCVDFAGYLAQNHGKVLYVAKEEKLDATLQRKLKDMNVAHSNLFVADNLPTDLSGYQFVILDSVNKLRLNPQDLAKLKADNPGICFIYVFQSTKEGKFKGANEFQHDVDVVIEVPQRGKAIQYGRFNQGGEINIFESAIIYGSDELSGIKKSKKKIHAEPISKNSKHNLTVPQNRSMLDATKNNAVKKIVNKGIQTIKMVADINDPHTKNFIKQVWESANEKKRGEILDTQGYSHKFIDWDFEDLTPAIQQLIITAENDRPEIISKIKSVDWTKPEHLDPKDCKDLQNVKKLFNEGKLKEAMKYASDLDTIIREEIPPEIWQAIGGKLTQTGKDKLTKKFNPSKYNDREDDLNPQFMFSTKATQLLVEALKGEFDINYLIRKELANRGLDKNGKWVGFDKAKTIHQVE